MFLIFSFFFGFESAPARDDSLKSKIQHSENLFMYL